MGNKVCGVTSKHKKCHQKGKHIRFLLAGKRGGTLDQTLKPCLEARSRSAYQAVPFSLTKMGNKSEKFENCLYFETSAN